MTSYKSKILILVLATLFFNSLAFAQQIPPQIQQQAQQEHIQNYDSEILVNMDGSINVTETIQVFAKGDALKRGIFRDYPTVSRSKYGKEIKPITITSVTKDGKPEPFFTESISDGLRLYIGEENVFLPVPAYYTYQINYIAQDQVRFFDDYDELYWNVTGNFWSLPINSTSASITLPFAAEKDQINSISYYGPVGSIAKGQTANITTQSNSSLIKFQHDTVLQPQEGITIAVNWPKGFVTQPAETTQNARLYASIAQVISGFALLLTATIVFYLLWRKHGKDQGGLPTIPVNFGPPEGVTPFELRFIDKMGKNDYVYLSTLIMQLAINGYVKIVEGESKAYSVVKTNKSTQDLSGASLELYQDMFGATEDLNFDYKVVIKELTEKKGFVERLGDIFSVASDPDGVFTFSKANITKVQALQKIVDRKSTQLRKKYIVSNTNIVGKMFLLNMMAFLLFGFIQLCLYVIVVGTDFSYFGTFLAPDDINIFGYVFVVLIAVESIYVGSYMPRRTNLAREIQDKSEGFKIFLKSQEYYLKGLSSSIPERFNMYEKYLPYAIALDLEPVWSAKFKNEIAQMANIQKENYQAWYIGNGNNTIANFSSQAFASGVASSMRTTSSHSGSSGFSGGSSGGGGGGGGGGGW